MEDDTEEHYEIETWYEHIIAEYANMPITDVYNLEIVTFLQLRRDAFIARLQRTEKGQEYLKKAWMLEQTKPDRKALREAFGKGGKK